MTFVDVDKQKNYFLSFCTEVRETLDEREEDME